MIAGIVLCSAVLSLVVYFTAQRLKKERRRAALQEAKNELPDYGVYNMNGGEKVFYTLLAAGFLFALAYVFYRSVFIAALAAPFAVFYPRIKSRELAAARKYELNLQFKDALDSLAASLSAGRSVENAFKEVVKDLALLYPGADAYIIREFAVIAGRIEMNEPVEDALAGFARRSGLEDIANFAEVFAIGKKSGGNMVEIMRTTSSVIGDKLRIKEEINTLLSQRKMEQKVLNVMPVLLLILLSWSAGDYMAPVFQTAFGRFAMTAAVLLLAAAYYISRKITDIEV
ncbi:MAG: type II secretion system F family protein [Peptococcaceae bacterium]|jgi:tight adherence protein B|nr:type II secretion system F family protein [Peptococcaceae bacterium]MDH7525092.1 type II secretion system F family protein [Peptococcaceae bacterium]